jgi:DtxR family Mn-dependent transcriptional regulator
MFFKARLNMQSENAEMYLVTMVLLEEEGNPTPIPLPLLAEELEVQAVSVNQMIRKLEEAGLVSYEPYKGVSFTDEGTQEAMAILRHRRLWETFFVEHLGYTSHEADALACRMEHITETEIADRLSQYLNHPQASPTGKVIPQSGSQVTQFNHISLSSLQAGESAEVVAIKANIATTSYLQGQNIGPGTLINVQAVSSNKTWLIYTEKDSLSLTEEIADAILVSRSKI